MTISAFKRMGQSVLTLLGEDAFLRGSVPCRVNIEHNIEVNDNDAVYERSVATLSLDVEAKVGDDLSHPDGRYRLDRRLADNGVNQRFILLEVK